MNEFVIIGKVVETPKQLESEKGNIYTNLLVEVDRNYSGTDSNPSTDMFKLVSFKSVANELCEKCKKGTTIAIRGRLQANNYTKENGEPGYRCELVCEKYELVN